MDTKNSSSMKGVKKTLISNIIAISFLFPIGIAMIVFGSLGKGKISQWELITFGAILIVLGVCAIIFAVTKYKKDYQQYLKILENIKSGVVHSAEKMKYLQPIPKVFTKKYDENYHFDDKEIFKQEFVLKSYKLPNGFKEFVNSGKVYRLDEDEACALDIVEPVEFDKIEQCADDLLNNCDVFLIPPHCIPFAGDRSGHVCYVLDYNLCGKQGEPRVLSIDDELIDYDYGDDDSGNERIEEYYFNEKLIAESFSAFLSKLSIVEY